VDISSFSIDHFENKTLYKKWIGKYTLNIIVGVDMAGRTRSNPRDSELSLDKYNYFSVWFEFLDTHFYPGEEIYSKFIDGLNLKHAGGTLAECCFREVTYSQLETIYNNMVNFLIGNINPISSLPKKTEEKSCKVCNKINDVGINCCWWCGVENPC
jgi:hypothetical protein